MPAWPGLERVISCPKVQPLKALECWSLDLTFPFNPSLDQRRYCWGLKNDQSFAAFVKEDVCSVSTGKTFNLCICITNIFQLPERKNQGIYYSWIQIRWHLFWSWFPQMLVNFNISVGFEMWCMGLIWHENKCADILSSARIMPSNKNFPVFLTFRKLIFKKGPSYLDPTIAIPPLSLTFKKGILFFIFQDNYLDTFFVYLLFILDTF